MTVVANPVVAPPVVPPETDPIIPPQVQDPFGPDLKLFCPVCLEDAIANPKIFRWGFYDCNNNEVRASAIDFICTTLKEASIADREVSWIRPNMSVDWDELNKTGLLRGLFTLEEEAILKDKLLTPEGYFSIGNMHGSCEGCIFRWVADKLDPDCVKCREPHDTSKKIFILASALNEKICGKLNLREVDQISTEDQTGTLESPFPVPYSLNPQHSTLNIDPWRVPPPPPGGGWSILKVALCCIALAAMAYVAYQVAVFMITQPLPPKPPQLHPFQFFRNMDLV